MRTFGTQGPVNPRDNYVVTRAQETADFIKRVKDGKYIVIFAVETKIWEGDRSYRAGKQQLAIYLKQV